MIVSHKHKFIFIKTRKTAGTSLEIVLSSVCGDDDILTPITEEDEKLRQRISRIQAQNFKIPKHFHSKIEWYGQAVFNTRRKFYNHISAQEVRHYLGKKIWDDYFVFCVERNPFEKILSSYSYAGGDSKYGSVSQFIDQGMMRSCIDFDKYSYGGVPIVDEVFRYENLASFNEWFNSKLNVKLPLQLSDVKAKSGYRKNMNNHQFTSEDIRKIEIAFAREIKQLGYSR